MQKVTCCQPPKLVSFTVLLRQDTFCQVLYEWTSLVFADEHSLTFLSVCRRLTGPTLSAFVAGCLLSNTVWMGFSSPCWWTQRNFPLFLPQTGRSHTGFELDLRLYPCLANRSLPFEVCGKGWPLHRIRKSRSHLASCGAILLLPRCNLLAPLVLRHLLLLSSLPL